MKIAMDDLRKKTRFATEARFSEPALQFLDSRGKIIGAIFPEVRKLFTDWKSDVEKVVFYDEKRENGLQLIVGASRVALVAEDSTSLDEFTDLAEKTIGLTYDALLRSVPNVRRFGVRFIEVVSRSEDKSFDAVKASFEKAFLRSDLKLPFSTTDLSARIIHKYGAVTVGPVKKEEDWLKQNFAFPDENVPDVGFGLDVDSYADDLALRTKNDWLQAFEAVLTLTESSETGLLKALGICDE